jgi:hypothetical protein
MLKANCIAYSWNIINVICIDSFYILLKIPFIFVNIFLSLLHLIWREKITLESNLVQEGTSISAANATAVFSDIEMNKVSIQTSSASCEVVREYC